MPRTRQNDETAGCCCNFVQCPEISSSTIRDTSDLFPQSRRTYRNFRMLPEISNPIIPNPVNSETRPGLSSQISIGSLIFIFVSSIVALYYFYSSFPELTDKEKTHLKLPWNIDDAKQLGLVLDKYKQDNYIQVLGGVFLMYIFLQTFAIPGSLFLSILSGFLFPFFLALLLVCVCSAVGASLCFLLSQLLGRKLVLKYFPEKAQKWSEIVNKHKDNLFNYIVFLRVTPFLPNWFINLSAPVIGVPLLPFATGTFIGVAPPSFVAIQTGQTLYKMSSTDSPFSWMSIGLLGVFAVMSLIPIFFKNRLKHKFE